MGISVSSKIHPLARKRQKYDFAEDVHQEVEEKLYLLEKTNTCQIKTRVREKKRQKDKNKASNDLKGKELKKKKK